MRLITTHIAFLFIYSNFTFSQPDSIPDLKLWLVADSTILQGDSVVSWTDLSGSGNNAVQSSLLAQPIKIDSVFGLNNKPIIRFDGVDDYMNFNVISTIRSVFTIVKHATGNQYGAPLLGHPNLYDFTSDATTLFGGSTSPNILNGNVYVNGILMSPLSISKPTNYTLLSIITTANVSAEYITNDRNYIPTRNWNGDYAEIIIYDRAISDSERIQVEEYLYNKYSPSVNLGADLNVNYGFCDTVLDAGSNFVSYLWNTGNTTQKINIDSSGTYSVITTDIFGRLSADTISITINNPNFIIQSDTLTCGEPIKWDVGLPHSYIFQWQDNSNDSLFVINQTGQYWVTVFDTLGCFSSDTSNIIIDTFPKTTSLGPDTNFCAGGSISLINGAQQAVSYLWSTGDTTSSIIITQTGSSTYTLTVQNTNGCTAKDTIIVSVNGVNPTVSFNVSATCQGDSTFFTNNTTVPSPDSIASWLWSFGDATTDSVQDPSHLYSSPGSYTVVLTAVSDSGCSDTAQLVVNVADKPLGDFIVAQSCTGEITNFTDLSSVAGTYSVTAWAWDFGDTASGSNNFANVPSPVHIYTAAGNYTVQLVVTTNANCTDTVANIVTVVQTPLALFSADTVCEGAQTSFFDNSIGPVGNWAWNFGDAGTSIAKNPVHQYAAAGTYSVVLTVFNLGCTDSDTMNVLVYSLPVTDFNGYSACVNTPEQFNDLSTVAGSTITGWNWQFGALGTSTQQNPSFIFSSTGTVVVSLTATSAQGCSSSIAYPVIVNPVPAATFTLSADFGANPLTVNFSGGGTGLNYSWNFGDPASGNNTSSLQAPAHVYNDTGTYVAQLIVENQFGCFDTITDDIVVAFPFLDAAIMNVYTIRQPDNVQVQASIYNNGTVFISVLELSAYLDDGTPVKETWTGLLNPKKYLSYTFNSSFEVLDGNSFDVACVEIKKVNGTTDEILLNNKSCTSIENDFTVLNPFPNPATDDVYFFIIIPQDGSIALQVYDMRGRIVEERTVEGTSGLNQITYNTATLRNGIYSLRVIYEENTQVKMFMKE